MRGLRCGRRGCSLALTGRELQFADHGSLVNYGVIDFAQQPYFNVCGTCLVRNAPGAEFVVHNEDGDFGHSFNIESGTFNNEGLIKIAGTFPGVSIGFGLGATVTNQGKAEWASSLGEEAQYPQWLKNFIHNTTADTSAAAQAIEKLGGLQVLTANLGSTLSAHFLKIGAAACAQANVGVVLAHITGSVCLMSDPNGLSGIVLTVGGELGIGFEKG